MAGEARERGNTAPVGALRAETAAGLEDLGRGATNAGRARGVGAVLAEQTAGQTASADAVLPCGTGADSADEGEAAGADAVASAEDEVRVAGQAGGK